MRIAIIGGGAAGFFAAIEAKQNYPTAQVIIYEKTQKVLSKVRVSGGGRCNVTSAITSIKELVEALPRGGKKLKGALKEFSTRDTVEWFEKRGVELYAQEDMRMFPTSDNSQTIIDCLMKEVERLGIKVGLGHGVSSIEKKSDHFTLSFFKDKIPAASAEKIIVANGGSPKRSGFDWLESLGHKIIDPVPSLFTFNIVDKSITALMGVAVENVALHIQGTKLKSDGPLLITHWGMSGPAVLKLSSLAARELHKMHYDFYVQINWSNMQNDEHVISYLQAIKDEHPKKKLSSVKPFNLPARLWSFFLIKAELSEQKLWEDLGKKALNKLTAILRNDSYQVKGKTTFKEEFVTCGGVSLDSIDMSSMHSKVCENLYFAGEVMDIDGITGGFNFQSAWTTGYIAGKLRS